MQCYFCTFIISTVYVVYVHVFYSVISVLYLLQYYCTVVWIITSPVDSSGTKLICRIKIKKSDRSLSIVSSENCHQKVRLVHAFCFQVL